MSPLRLSFDLDYKAWLAAGALLLSPLQPALLAASLTPRVQASVTLTRVQSAPAQALPTQTIQVQGTPMIGLTPAAPASAASSSATSTPPQAEGLSDDGLAPPSEDQTAAHAAHMATLVNDLRATGFAALLESASLDDIWFEAMAFDGSTNVFRKQLYELLADQAPFEDRALAMWVRAGLDMREGDFSGAEKNLKDLSQWLEDFGDRAASVETVEREWLPLVRFERTRLADMRGQEKVARSRFGELARDLEAWGTHPDLAQRLRLRLALMEEKVGDQPGDALATLAREGDPDTQRRAAVVLGLRGQPEEALNLYPRDFAGESESTTFRHLARLAEWALTAEDAVRAQSLAWDAAEVAKLRRDRNYGLSLLMEAYRLDDTLGLLIERVADLDATERAAGRELSDEWLDFWIELLRETERTDEAIALFEERGATMDQDKRSSLIQLYNEGGRHADMVAALQREIDADPRNLAWRELLSRDHLERGNQTAAEAVWRAFVDAGGAGFGDESLLVGFYMLSDQGLDDLAVEVAERAIAEGHKPLGACLLLFGLHQNRGELDKAEAALERMQTLAPDDAPERLDLAEAWERLGRLDRAIEVLEGVVATRGKDQSGEDLAMHLAWLYSEVGDEEQALVEWRDLWTRVNSIARRRYVEDRMMTVASRLGTLADIAIDLETKLFAGEADEREAGLLVRLYTMVQDAVSATEVLEEFLLQKERANTDLTDEEARQAAIAGLEEKGRVYLACLDYFHFEETVQQIIELDPAGESEYLQQLAMSQLERGRPDQAQTTLARLQDVEGGASQVAEFQAGVLALAGLRDEAILAYRAGIAQNPDRIESWLLLGNLMKDNGEGNRAVNMYQQLAETAQEDDLFMIAVDGLLNLEANERTLTWARRLTWERLAGRSDKAYLYQLSADLSDATNDQEGVLVALESSLSISGERRSSVLRELIDRTSNRPGGQFDQAKNLAFSRRLLGLGEFVPPDVYLSLGESFLDADDPAGAERTFRKATEVPDRASFERQTAQLFEEQDYPAEALSVYERSLSGEPTNAGLMVKVGELHERLGDFDLAHQLYTRTVDLLLARLPLVSTQADQRKAQGALSFWQTRNVDDFDRYFPRAKLGWLATLNGAEIQATVQAALATLRADLDTALALDSAPEQLVNAPRILHRARFVRDLALIAGHPEWLHAFDVWLLDTALPDDPDLLPELLDTYLVRGYLDAARAVVQASRRGAKEKEKVNFLVGLIDTETLPQRLEIAQTRALLLPLIIESRDSDVALLLARTNLAGIDAQETDSIGMLLNAAMFVDDQDLSLRLGREWIRLLLQSGRGEWELRPVIERMESVLEPDDFRSLCRYVAEIAMQDPDKGQAVMSFLPTLEAKLDIELFTTDQLFELLDARQDLGYGYGIDSLIQLFPEDLRPTVLRTVIPRILPSARARFALDYVSGHKGPITGDMADILVGAVETNLKDADDYISYMFGNLGSLSANQALGLRLIRLRLETDESDIVSRKVEMQLLQGLEETDQAIELARTLWDQIAGQDLSADWQQDNAKREVETLLKEQDFDWLLEHTSERLADQPDERREALITLLQNNQREAEALALIDTELAATPADDLDARIALLDQRASLFIRLQRPRERMSVYDEILALQLEKAAGDETDADVQRTLKRLKSSWVAYRQPARALSYAERITPDEPSAEEKPKGNTKLPPALQGINLPPGSVLIFNNTTYIIGEDNSDKASIESVKSLAEKGDAVAAQQMLRRVWRDFKPGISQSDRYGFNLFGGIQTPAWTWPEDKAQADGEAAEPVDPAAEPKEFLGGLLDYKKPAERKAVERQSAFEVLSGFPWGAEELRRMLATRGPDQLDSDNSRKLIQALLDRRVGDEPIPVRDALLANFNAGRSGKVEQIELLALLDENPELVSPAAEAALGTLSRTLRTGDFGPLRSLARLYARRGDVEEATRLYRWLATQVASVDAWYGDEIPRIPARELFDEVHSVLGEHLEACVQITQDIVDFATAGSDPWSRQSQDLFALSVWTELLDPVEALERLESTLATVSATDFSLGVRRPLATSAVGMYLRSGNLERALECLEVVTCTFDIALDPEARYYGGSPGYPNYLTDTLLNELFPGEMLNAPNADDEPDIDPAILIEWYPRVSERLIEWYQAGRTRGDTMARGVAFAAWRYHQLTGSELPQLEAYADLLLGLPAVAEIKRWSWNTSVALTTTPDAISSSAQLFAIDALRLSGRDGLALQLEAKLASEQSLSVGRLGTFLAHKLDLEGPEAVLDLANETLDLYHAEAIVTVARDAAQALGQAERVAELEALLESERAARIKLFELENPES